MPAVREMISNLGPIIYQPNGLGKLFNLSFQRSIGYSLAGAVSSTEDCTEVWTTWTLLGEAALILKK